MNTLENDIILRFKLDTRKHSRLELLPIGYKNWQFWVQPEKGFGQGYITVSTDNTAFQLIVNLEGTYNVLGIAEKKLAIS